MMNLSFALILTICGTSVLDVFVCNDYVIEGYKTEVECLRVVQTVYNQEYTEVYNVMGDLGEPYKLVTKQELHCSKVNVD